MKNIAILGAGYIATRVAKGIQYSKNGHLYAVASRSMEKARDFAQEYNIEKYYGSYESMLEDENVDIVYICTPNHVHYDQIKMCMDYCKHVICEKPMVKNISQVKELFAYAKDKNCFLMEAHKTCFTPLNQYIFNKIQSKEYGDVISVIADYSYDCKDQYSSDSWAMHPEYGGCSYDVGVYAAVICDFFANSKLKNITGFPIRKDGFVADFGMQTQLKYENGVIAQANCNWMYFSKNKGNAFILTTKGTIDIPAFWKSNHAFVTMDGITEEITVEMDSDFTGEVEEAVNCIEQGLLESKTMGCDASCEIMRIIEEVNSYRLKK